MFVSCDPLSGSHLDVYPEYAQNLLKKLKNGEHIFLGPDCFNATVYLKDQIYYQVTPAAQHVNKDMGLRSIAYFEGDNITIYKNFSNRWKFTADGPTTQRILGKDLLRYPATSSIWQWSSKVGCDVNHIQENHWISYSKEDSDVIENGFKQNQTHVDISVGMKQYTIVFYDDSSKHKSIYAVQIDAHDSHRRRICRRAMRPATSFQTPPRCETCVLCTEDFQDTAHIPWLTISCGHTFHGVCLERMIMSNHDMCPLCRQSFV